MRRPLIASLAAAAALVLSACGSATVDNSQPSDAAPTTLASASPSASATSVADGTEETEPGSPAAPAAGNSGDAGAAPAQDRGAREIDEVPDAPERPEDEQTLLNTLKDGGIDVAGVEDQLITAARAACNQDDKVTVQAISGQLIEQGKTDLAIGDVITLIEDSARTGYCQQ